MAERLTKILDACQRVSESRLRCFIIALVLSSLVIFVASAAWVPADANDDYAIGLALSGHWGAGDGRTLFVNVLLGNFIFFMNGAFPALNWFVICELVSSWLAYLAIIYLSLRHSSLPMACLIVVGSSLLLIPGSTWSSNFTYVSLFSAIAGGMAIMYAIREERLDMRLVVVGAAFLAFASMMRIEVFLMCIPFYMLGAISLLPMWQQSKRDARGLVRIVPMVLALCLGLGLFAVDRVLWQEEPWKSWYDFNDARSIVEDFQTKDYDSISDELSAIGVSENDYAMVDNLWIEDNDFFTGELFVQLDGIAPADVFSLQHLGSSATSYAKRLSRAELLLFVIAMALVVGAFSLKRRRWFLLCLVALVLFIAVVFTALGRLPDRVHNPLWMFVIAIECVHSRQTDRPWSIEWTGHETKSVLASCASFVSMAVPLVATAAIVFYALSHYSVERLQATYAPSTYEPESSLVEYYEEHPDNVFVQNQLADRVIRFTYRMRGIAPHDVIYRSCSLGGWATHSPYRMAQYDSIGMENVIKGLVENENALLVMGGSSEPTELQTYLREHYYPECTYRHVDTIECPEVGVTLRVFDFDER